VDVDRGEYLERLHRLSLDRLSQEQRELREKKVVWIA